MGQLEADFHTDAGPWNDFEVVDGVNPGDVVGVRRKSDGPEGKIWIPADMLQWPNPTLSEAPLVIGEEVDETAGLEGQEEEKKEEEKE
jgi:hypothetical protein